MMTKEELIKKALLPFAILYYELSSNGKASVYADNEHFYTYNDISITYGDLRNAYKLAKQDIPPEIKDKIDNRQGGYRTMRLLKDRRS